MAFSLVMYNISINTVPDVEFPTETQNKHTNHNVTKICLQRIQFCQAPSNDLNRQFGGGNRIGRGSRLNVIIRLREHCLQW